MTDTTLVRARRRPSHTVQSFVTLLKPRVMSLVVFTAAVGLFAAPSAVDPLVALISIALIAIGAGASGALNMWWDADIDAVMRRTRNRPIPDGQVAPEAALGFGLALSALSVAALYYVANPIAAYLLAFTIFFYAVIYSMILKRRTPQNIVIGGAAGAFPPMIGWAVATGGIAPESIALFMLIFLWTPPHFWALALYMNDDFTRAGIPMLTVTHGRRTTRRHIFAYTCVLAPVALAISFTGIGGPVYLVSAVALNAAFLHGAWAIRARTEEDAEADRYRSERRFFRLSLIYLFVHFLAIWIDAIFRSAGLSVWADWADMLQPITG